MKQEKQQAIALMRYGAIAPLIAGLDEDYPSKTAFYMELSTKGLVGPDGLRASLCTLNHRKMVSGLSEPRV